MHARETADMPIAHLSILEGRPKEKRVALIRNVTHAIAESLDVPAERVRVVVQEVPLDHWGIGGETAEERRRGGG
ncbi:2-hydroxymuconate tautomerase family protein [Arhodomonas aquaeolei]|uniref:2-hydroxymuconate tautomerase family protein n=1 Tax=Arhodomonas aquaeolei TaxID=2369 RepID=UPI0021698411|nr:2-hydroxymuconate tautomerase family protein [Arhodomonas aquaeolei]MCS4505825.1 2-hydroxymuconate tautomerase family protein [Arhodomonas aquaeolei]